VKAADVYWRREAACTSHDPELFFPIGSAGPAVRQTERAKQICNECPARIPCLEWALQTGADHGVWGGLSEQDRQSLRRRRRRNAGSLDQKAGPTPLIPETASRRHTANAGSTRNPNR